MEIAVCTLSSDLYIKGTQTLLYSLIKNNDWFAGDFVVLYHDTYCPLSRENRDKLTSIYSNVKFKEVNEKNYKKLFSVWNGHISKDKMIRAFKFESFLLTEYDRIMFIDSDCLIDGNIEELFAKNTNFCAAVNDYKERTTYDTKIKKGAIINTGVMLFDKRTIGKVFFDSVITTGSSMSLYGDRYKAIDVEVLNERLFNRYVTIIPSKFNTLKRTEDVGAVIYHFNNKKPWESTVGFETMGYRWQMYFDESLVVNQKNIEKRSYSYEYVNKTENKAVYSHNHKQEHVPNKKNETYCTNTSKRTNPSYGGLDCCNFNMKKFEEEYNNFIKEIKENK